GSEFDSMLVVRESCIGEEIACNDDFGSLYQSAVLVSLEAGDSVVVVVDGYSSGSHGDYDLSVGMVTPTRTRRPTYTPTPTPALDEPLDHPDPINPVHVSELLYWGDDPAQPGVTPGTIDPRRAAIVRGRVTTASATPLAGVTITVLDHPEFGSTT